MQKGHRLGNIRKAESICLLYIECELFDAAYTNLKPFKSCHIRFIAIVIEYICSTKPDVMGSIQQH